MIFGIRAVMEAIQAGREVDKIMVKKDFWAATRSFPHFVLTFQVF